MSYYGTCLLPQTNRKPLTIMKEVLLFRQEAVQHWEKGISRVSPIMTPDYCLGHLPGLRAWTGNPGSWAKLRRKKPEFKEAEVARIWGGKKLLKIFQVEYIK